MRLLLVAPCAAWGSGQILGRQYCWSSNDAIEGAERRRVDQRPDTRWKNGIKGSGRCLRCTPLHETNKRRSESRIQIHERAKNCHFHRQTQVAGNGADLGMRTWEYLAERRGNWSRKLDAAVADELGKITPETAQFLRTFRRANCPRKLPRSVRTAERCACRVPPAALARQNAANSRPGQCPVGTSHRTALIIQAALRDLGDAELGF